MALATVKRYLDKRAKSKWKEPSNEEYRDNEIQANSRGGIS